MVTMPRKEVRSSCLDSPRLATQLIFLSSRNFGRHETRMVIAYKHRLNRKCGNMQADIIQEKHRSFRGSKFQAYVSF